MPGIGCGKDPVGTVRGTLSNVVATTLDGFQGYVRYGSSEESAAYSTEQPRTPFTGTGNIGSYLASQVNRGTPVYYTQVLLPVLDCRIPSLPAMPVRKSTTSSVR